MKGVFELKAAPELFAKLKWEYKELSSDPADSYVAYNFFVTSWHLLEWLYPNEKKKREEMREQNPILQVCEHLAVGAKHFEPTNQKLKSVAGTGRSSFWPKGYWHPNFWAKGYWKDSLVVELTGVAREQFGAKMDVLQLAEEVMKFWKNNEDLSRKVT